LGIQTGSLHLAYDTRASLLAHQGKSPVRHLGPAILEPSGSFAATSDMPTPAPWLDSLSEREVCRCCTPLDSPSRPTTPENYRMAC